MDFWLKYKRILQFFALKPPVLARKGGRVKGTEGLRVKGTARKGDGGIIR